MPSNSNTQWIGLSSFLSLDSSIFRATIESWFFELDSWSIFALAELKVGGPVGTRDCRPLIIDLTGEAGLLMSGV